MALMEFKMVTQDFRNLQSVHILHRIPNMRICLILKVLALMSSEVDNLENHIN